jgi:hypothetical protein
MKGVAFLVKSTDEIEIFREVPNTELVERLYFPDQTLFTAIEDKGDIAVITRNHKSFIFNKEQFNRHFEIKL